MLESTYDLLALSNSLPLAPPALRRTHHHTHHHHQSSHTHTQPRQDWIASVLYDLSNISEEAHAAGRYPNANIVNEALVALPQGQAVPILKRMFLRLVCWMTGTATTRGGGEPLPPTATAADVHALKLGSVLLHGLRAVPRAANELYDSYEDELRHLCNAPGVVAAVRDRSANTVLARNMIVLFEEVLDTIYRGRLTDNRAKKAAMPQADVGNRASAHRALVALV